MSSREGRRAAPSRRVLAATGIGVAVAVGPALHAARVGSNAELLTRAMLAVAALAAVALLVRRAWPGPLGRGMPWLTIALAVAVEATYQLVAIPDGSDVRGVGNVGHLVAALLLAAALWRLPAPVEDRRGTARVVLDAVVAGLAFAVPSWELVVPGSDEQGWALLGVMLHPGVNVVLATACVVVVSRGRRTGGLGLRPLICLTVGALTLVLADMLARSGAEDDVVATLLTVALTSVAVAAGLPDNVELELAQRWRERVAVLAPLAPLVGAGAAVLGAVVFHERLSSIASACVVLLSLATVASGVLARFEHLAMERTLDETVLQRTITLGTREKWFRSLVQNSSDVITVVDVRGIVRYQTPSMARILGHDPQALVGTRISGLLRPADGRRLESALASAARNPGRPVTLDLPFWHKSGRWCETETTITSLVHDPDIRGLVLNTRDVSERRRLEEQLTQQAFSDPLTGLANRSLFRSKVESALRVALGSGEVAVLFLDLNGFKAVNDAHGHHVGDELLGIVGKRLANSVRPGDLVARLGGDEFGILVSGGPDAEEGAIWVAERVRRALAAPFVLDGRQIPLGASTGIAVSDSGSETADQLLRNADLAMYRAKSRRDLSFVRFEVKMHDALLARMQAEADLRQAVGRGDLVLYYQPVVELGSGRIIGVEALVRWRHLERGIISPAEFIDLAEETGLVGDIGSWALQECCMQAARWQRFAAPNGVFKVAVNVSARQLDAALPRLVHDAINANGIPGAALTLEMTESVLMERTDEVVELLRRMKSLGVKVAVDDFGTGYSSLSYLSRFPVDILKIDRSFVSSIGSDHVGQAELVETIVRLGQSLRLDTVAEGIETEDQRVALRDMGCTFGQGFLFSRPVPPEEVDVLLEAQAEQTAVATSA